MMQHIHSYENEELVFSRGDMQICFNDSRCADRYNEWMHVSGDADDGDGWGFGVDFTVGEGDGSDSYGWGPDWGPNRWANFK